MSDVCVPPFGFELHRRQPFLMGAYGNLTANQVVDNSGAVAPTGLNPSIRLTSGGVGANKTQEYGTNIVAAGDNPLTTDIFASHDDPDFHGFWRRDLHLSAFVRKQGYTGIQTPTSYVGIGLGSYAIPPPDPATAASNVVRLVLRTQDLSWYLITHRGDGVSAQVITPLNVPHQPINQISGAGSSRSYRLDLYVKAGEYVAAAVDGIEGARITSGLPVVGLGPAALTLYSYFVTSGTDASSNVRGVFHSMMLETFGM